MQPISSFTLSPRAAAFILRLREKGMVSSYAYIPAPRSRARPNVASPSRPAPKPRALLPAGRAPLGPPSQAGGKDGLGC